MVPLVLLVLLVSQGYKEKKVKLSHSRPHVHTICGHIHINTYLSSHNILFSSFVSS